MSAVRARQHPPVYSPKKSEEGRNPSYHKGSGDLSPASHTNLKQSCRGIVAALARTIALQAAIDAAIGEWPLQ